jgi:hypothetical protein
VEPSNYLVFVPFIIVFFLIFSWLNGEDDKYSTIMQTALFTIIAIGAMTYYQAAKKACDERAAAEAAKVASTSTQKPLISNSSDQQNPVEK